MSLFRFFGTVQISILHTKIEFFLVFRPNFFIDSFYIISSGLVKRSCEKTDTTPFTPFLSILLLLTVDNATLCKLNTYVLLCAMPKVLAQLWSILFIKFEKYWINLRIKLHTCPCVTGAAHQPHSLQSGQGVSNLTTGHVLMRGRHCTSLLLFVLALGQRWIFWLTSEKVNSKTLARSQTTNPSIKTTFPIRCVSFIIKVLPLRSLFLTHLISENAFFRIFIRLVSGSYFFLGNCIPILLVRFSSFALPPFTFWLNRTTRMIGDYCILLLTSKEHIVTSSLFKALLIPVNVLID